jgi:mevalonate kinase
MALSIPYSKFEGKLSFRSQNNLIIDPELKAFCQYLKEKEKRDELNFPFDIENFEKDISQGLYFDSTIPQGYGIGSSGALCASIYNQYCHQDGLDIKNLKESFSQMESHFHGASSGVDPLISFLNSSILITENNEFNTVEIPKYLDGEGGIFLLNTGRSRRTEPLVNLFLEKCKHPDYEKLISTVLAPITNRCIDSFLKSDSGSLYEFFRELSDFQYRHFGPMIPNLFTDIWAKGLETEKFYLKLCGAGGGGFLLGMTSNFKESKEALSEHEIRPLFYF